MINDGENAASCGCDCDCGSIPDNKMCMMSSPPSKFDIEKVKELTNDPRFICKCCGRTANDSENLCSPVDLK